MEMDKRGFDPRAYWEQRLRAHPDLRGVGHRRFSVMYNEIMYQVAAENLSMALTKAQITVAGKSILDIGPGLGHFVRRYLEWGAARVTGVDITQVSVDELRRKYPDQHFICADISAPALVVGDVYDLVCAINVVFHILEDHLFQRAIGNMSERVKPGGALLIVDSFMSSHWLHARHARSRGLRSYMPILKENGFVEYSIYPMYYVMSRAVALWLFERPQVMRALPEVERWMRAHVPIQWSSMQYLIARRPS
jgi:SAM-dependent methyltransferase